MISGPALVDFLNQDTNRLATLVRPLQNHVKVRGPRPLNRETYYPYLPAEAHAQGRAAVPMSHSSLGQGSDPIGFFEFFCVNCVENGFNLNWILPHNRACRGFCRHVRTQITLLVHDRAARRPLHHDGRDTRPAMIEPGLTSSSRRSARCW